MEITINTNTTKTQDKEICESFELLFGKENSDKKGKELVKAAVATWIRRVHAEAAAAKAMDATKDLSVT